MSVTKFIDITNLGKDVGDKTARELSLVVQRLAISKVAVKDGVLKNSIVQSKTATGYAVHSDVEYSLAQEYGLAEYGKPNYTFTPYMRPASTEAMKHLPSIAMRNKK